MGQHNIMGTKKIHRDPSSSPPTPAPARQVTTRQGRRVIKQRYLLKQELGQGGIGQTFLAQDTHFGDMCVIKIVKGDYLSIQREARQLCYLKHENIPAYRDFMLESSEHREDEAFLVQEYIRGKTLKTYANEQGGKLSLSRCLAILEQLLEILEYLHSRKDPDSLVPAPVLHLDIKPDNILIRDADQQLFLIDFGLSAQAHLSELNQQGITPSVQGYTPGFSPNEQIKGRVVPASDLYALGMTFLVLLTGRDVNDLRWHLEQDRLFQEPRQIPQLPARLKKYMTRLVATQVEDRFLSAKQARQALRRILRIATWMQWIFWLLLLSLLAYGYFIHRLFTP